MRLAALAAVLGLVAACTVQPDPPDDRPRVEQVQPASFNAPHGVEFKVVDDGSSYTKELLQQVALDRQRGTLDDDIAVETDRWRTDETAPITDFYLTANTREALKAYVADHDGAPPGREIVYGQQADGRWRTYLVFPTAEIDNAGIAQVDTTSEGLQLVFTPTAARHFGDLTARIAGHKLAVLVDGTVASAPVIQSAITGGRAQITFAAR